MKPAKKDAVHLEIDETKRLIKKDARKSEGLKNIGKSEDKVSKITPRILDIILPTLTDNESRTIDSPKNIRFRDWNPDVKWALRRGVDLIYSSRINEIVCPSLGISSSTVSSSGSYSSGGSYRSSSSRGTGVRGSSAPSRESSRSGSEKK